MLVGALAAVLGVGAAVGIALGGGDDDDPVPTLGPVPSQPARTQGPVVSLAPPPTQSTSTQAPQTQPPENPTPEPTAQGGQSGGQTITTDTLSVTVPADWQVDKKEGTFASILTSSGGQFFLESGYLKAGATTAQVIQAQIASRKEKSPDLKVCEAEADFKLPNGPTGRAIYLCYTFKTSSGSQYPAVVFIAVHVDTSGNQPLLYYLKIFSGAKDWDAVVKEVNAVLPSVQWKLYSGG